MPAQDVRPINDLKGSRARRARLLAASLLAGLVAAALPAGVATSNADAAARTPTAKERKAIKKAALRDCRKNDLPQYCRADRYQAVVSTSNPRFAYGGVSGDHYSGPFLRRAKGSKVWTAGSQAQPPR